MSTRAQIKSHIKSLIADGTWRAGDAVPSEAELMQSFGVSRMTAHRALYELSQQGLLVRSKGATTRVAQLYLLSSQMTLRSIKDEIRERNMTHVCEVVTLEKIAAPQAVAQLLHLRKKTPVFHSLCLHFANNSPLQLEDRYVNPMVAPDYLEQDFADMTPTQYLLQHVPVTQAEFSIQACMPTAEQADLLHITPSEPCLRMFRTTHKGQTGASTAQLLYPASRHSFEGSFKL